MQPVSVLWVWGLLQASALREGRGPPARFPGQRQQQVPKCVKIAGRTTDSSESVSYRWGAPAPHSRVRPGQLPHGRGCALVRPLLDRGGGGGRPRPG